MNEQNRRDICIIYDIPPWLVGPCDRSERWWWHRTWPRRKYLAVVSWFRRLVPTPTGTILDVLGRG